MSLFLHTYGNSGRRRRCFRGNLWLQSGIHTGRREGASEKHLPSGKINLSFTKKGDGIIIQRPVYSPFRRLIESSGRIPVDNHLKNHQGYYEMDTADLEEKLKDPRNTMMLLCCPHNPVGRVWKREELNTVCRLCRQYGVVLVSDEIHADLVRCGR